MRTNFFKVGAIFLIGLTLTACQKEASNKINEREKQTVKIGFVAPLTGDVSNLGILAKEAAELAAKEFNSENDLQVELIIEDGQCGPKNASLAGNKLINNDQVTAIIGGFCSGETMAIAPIAEENHVPLISYASSNPKITEMGDYIFRNFPSDNFQGKFAAGFIYYNLGIKKVAILNCSEDYCLGIKDVFRQSFINNGGGIVSEEQFESTSKDFKTQLAKIKQTGARFVYTPSYAEAAINILKQARELGLEATFFGSDGWDDPTILKEFKEAAEGIMWTATQLSIPQSFKDKMEKEYGLDEVPNYAPQAYDAVKIMASAINKAGLNPEQIKNELYKVKNYQGVSGVISFDQHGDLESADYTVKVIRDGKVVEK